LFPRCAAVVHHGGVGTCAAGLAAGAPQVVAPFAFDQEDNGARLVRLGVGESLAPRRCTAANLTAALRRVMGPEVRARCQEVAAQCDHDGLELAADLVEALHRAGPRPPTTALVA
jgi:UDP:flavonoid glycosyltransferase YjiC (YdhE family)